MPPPRERATIFQPLSAAIVQTYLPPTRTAPWRWAVMHVTGEKSSEAYEVAFYRKGESAPFETRLAELYFSLWEKTNYRFNISRTDSQSQAELENLEALAKRMADPKLSEAEREQIMAKLQKAQEAMLARMKDPVAAVKAQQDKELQFGCERIELEYPGGSSFTGRLSCAEKVGRRIPLTGTVAMTK